VEGIPVSGKAPLFAERRRNGDLGRSVVLSRVTPRGRRRADDSGCPEAAEEGNVVAPAQRSAGSPHGRIRPCAGRRVLHSVLRPVRVDPHYARSAQKRRSRGEAFGSVSRLGKPTRVGGTSTGAERTGARGSPRATAPARERAWRVRKGRRSRPPSLRGIKSPGSCSHVVTQLQKSEGDLWPRISPANAPQKGRLCRVNGGLARDEGRRVKPSARVPGEAKVASRTPPEAGEDRLRAQGGVRASSSGHDIA